MTTLLLPNHVTQSSSSLSLTPHAPMPVSVLVPLYNAERFVVAALTSVLQENRVPLEVIVINDGSTDASLEQVEKLGDRRIKVINNSGKGIASALNAGLEIARGDVIVRCDADDLYPHPRLLDQVTWLLEHSEFGAVCGGYSVINEKAAPVIRFDCGTGAEEITQELRSGVTRTHFCTYAVRRDILRSLGGFRPYFCTGEDIDIQLRLGEACRVWFETGNYYHYRLHSGSITHTISSIKREFFDGIARQFQRQRQLEGLDDLERGCPPAFPPTYQPQNPPFSAAEHIQNLLLGKAWQEHQDGDRLQALATGLRSVMTYPRNTSAWRSLMALAIK